MRARLWFRIKAFVDRHATLIAFLVLMAFATAAVTGLRWEAEQRDKQVEAESVARATALAEETRSRAKAVEDAAVERRDQICAESRNLRALVSELIDTAVSGEPGVSLLAPDSFRLLPASVQQYLREYVALSAAGEENVPGLAERLRTFQRTRLGSLPEFCVAA